MNKTWFKITAGFMFFIFLISIMYLYVGLFYSKVYAGIDLEGMDVSGKTRTELEDVIKNWQKQYYGKHIIVYYGNEKFNLAAQNIDFDVDIEGTIQDILNYGRYGSTVERIVNISSAMNRGYHAKLKVKYDEVKLAGLIDNWKETVERPPRNAALSMVTGGIVPQEQGIRIDTELLRTLVIDAFKQDGISIVLLPVITVYPDITVEDITRTGIREQISNYSTIFNPDDANRTANVRLAAGKINGYIVYPGDKFSFNEIVGPREKETGFKEAMEIVNGEFVPGIGGGVCQVSSTLYNAVLLANLPIIERHNHSKPLSYVEMGRDATVVFDILDFKFTNNTNMPIMIMAEIEKNKLLIGIFGQHKNNVNVDILSTDKMIIPPAVIKVPDNDLYLGETKVDKQGREGYTITTVREISIDGREIKREILSKDKYLPDDTIIKVGTKIPLIMQPKLD